MAKFNFENFLNGLNERQKKAVLACKTELEPEKVMDDNDIEVTADIPETVTGGKGFMPFMIFCVINHNLRTPLSNGRGVRCIIMTQPVVQDNEIGCFFKLLSLPDS